MKSFKMYSVYFDGTRVAVLMSEKRARKYIIDHAYKIGAVDIDGNPDADLYRIKSSVAVDTGLTSKID